MANCPRNSAGRIILAPPPKTTRANRNKKQVIDDLLTEQPLSVSQDDNPLAEPYNKKPTIEILKFVVPEKIEK